MNVRTRGAKGVAFDVVSAVARRSLPGAVESTSYGTPALKVQNKLFARLWEDGETLVVRTDPVSRDHLLRANPKLWYLTDHYRDYPWILLRLTEVRRDQLPEILEDAWRLVAPKRLITEHAARPGRS